MPTDTQREYFDKALNVAGYEALSLKAMLQYAYSIKDCPDAIDAASAAWNRNALHYVHASAWFKDLIFNEVTYTTDFYLALVQCGSLSRANAALLWEEITDEGLELWQVKERATEMKKRAPREAKKIIDTARLFDLLRRVMPHVTSVSLVAEIQDALAME